MNENPEKITKLKNLLNHIMILKRFLIPYIILPLFTNIVQLSSYKEIKGNQHQFDNRANKIISNIILWSRFGVFFFRLHSRKWWSRFVWVIVFVVYRRISKRSLRREKKLLYDTWAVSGRVFLFLFFTSTCFLTNSLLSLTLYSTNICRLFF